MNAILIVKALLFVAEYLERFLDRAMLRIPVITGVKSWAGKQPPQKQNGFSRPTSLWMFNHQESRTGFGFVDNSFFYSFQP